jgi:tetratricopeptide (TPR) repeat protein
MKFYSLNMIGEAIRELEKVKPSTHDTEATTSCYMALGDLYFEDDQYNRAIANYIKARDLNPEDSLIWTKLGRCYFIKSEYKEAADLFMKVIENSAGKLDCEVLAARCRNKIKDFEEAMSRLNANCEHWKTISKDTRENIFARKNIPVSHKPTSLASPAYRRLALNSVARVILIVSVIFISFSVGHKPPADKKTVFTGTTAPPDPVTTANKAKAILPSKNSTLTAPKPEQRKNMAKERSMHRVKSNPEAKNTYLVQHPADSIRFK